MPILPEGPDERATVRLDNVSKFAHELVEHANAIMLQQHADVPTELAAFLFAAAAISKTSPTMNLKRLQENLALLYEHAPKAEAFTFNQKTDAKA